MLGLFLAVERRAENPLLPFSLFADKDRVATFVAIFFAGGVMFSLAAFVALFVQDILGYSPLSAGLAFVPFAFGLGAAAFITSKLVVRIQPRWLVMTGAAIMVGWLLFSVLTMNADSSYFPGIFFPVIGIGFGVGMASIPLPLCAIAGVPATEIGPLTAIALVAQTLGGPVALAVVGALATSRTLSLGGIAGPANLMNDAQLGALSSGYMFALFCCAMFALVAGLAAFFIRFTPQQVAQAQAAQEDVQSV